ncbi:hypothetical protein BT96DRAFT_1006229 [Gymnopus androsaceus JB14]|uniref:Uncharacterized protein n=1 Tax=Gymnopus androsaceus JB14 TaxID=1447944 RepID=A0A6A4GKW3_9AGAR|nr:hypothetical protein BT96DRAFT_1006229 [Gymnopus androsaceus JB14]
MSRWIRCIIVGFLPLSLDNYHITLSKNLFRYSANLSVLLLLILPLHRLQGLQMGKIDGSESKRLLRLHITRSMPVIRPTRHPFSSNAEFLQGGMTLATLTGIRSQVLVKSTTPPSLIVVGEDRCVAV